ncbi:MAG: twitching motility protein PilT [Candidatus Peregrinibacteria bacterium Greene1014_49]|nr:MAG: twitching motility protein PilT [Candidatus Peregrinibacteria bacterium Greene1014_49]
MDRDAVAAIFGKACELKASDVHIAAGCPVLFRINGQLTAQTKQIVTAAQAGECAKSILGDAAFKRFQEDREIDASFDLKDGFRFRVNCSIERGNCSVVARVIPKEIPSLEAIALNELAAKLKKDGQGLILFTGPTGCGKSTSMAAIIHSMLQESPVNVVTLEDPIEFAFEHGKGVCRQRQYGEDFLSFPDALKHLLRQDPDVVMVGEMRDPETIAAALTLAETGHLIFATLHTPNAIQTIDRIIDVFPPHQQGQVRSQLSMSLKAVVAQRLVPSSDGWRVAVREVLINTPAVAHIIRDNRTAELTSVLQTNEGLGMCTFEKAAKKLYKEGAIGKEVYETIMDTF